MTDTTDSTSAETPDEGGVSNVAPEDVGQTDVTEGSDSASEPDEDAETFPRSYVERLRRESAGYRERATKGDTYAARLHTELVRATGRLADPTDLTFDEDHLADADTMAAAIDDLLARKPHLASRRPAGDIGQGAVSGGGSNVDLAAILRQRAQ